MYRIIVSDLDDTLLTSDHKLTDRTLSAIQRARRAGVKFVPASGRGIRSITSLLEKIGTLDTAGEYMIGYNGGMIYENKDDRVIYSQGITFEEAETLFKRGLGYDVSIRIYTSGTVYVRKTAHDLPTANLGTQKVVSFDDRDISFLRDKDIIKCVFDLPDYDVLFRIEDDLRDVTGNMAVSYSSGRFLEFNRKGVDKGAALRILAKHLGVPMSETMALGDNYNDLAMIKAAGLGVAVANSVSEVREAADLVSDRTNDEDAAAEVIERFVLEE